jgi:hypothetical protein
MICLPCRTNSHHLCREGTWCDCAHREPNIAERAKWPIYQVLPSVQDAAKLEE